MTRGLIVGKFIPLHRGHQFLIETALAEVDDLTIVIYDNLPEGDYPPMPVKTRARWISKLYPRVENIVTLPDIYADDVPQEVKDSPEAATAYAEDLAFLGKFDKVFTSEDYGDAFALSLWAEHVCVDEARIMVPCSGTLLRENLFAYRTFIDPVVYRDLVQKVVFVGTESAGKSTLARRMAWEMDTRWVHEYGRELWEAQGLTGSFHDQLKIANHQYAREEAAILQADRFLFCDTNAWTTLQWWEMFNNTADIRLYDMVEKTKHEYIWILCQNDFDWVQDGTRELIGRKSQYFQRQQIEALWDLEVPWLEVTGSVENRINQVCGILNIDVGVQGGH